VNSYNDNLLVDLDCIWDTRIPILNRIDRQSSDTILKENTYHTRISDLFSDLVPDFDNSSFLKAYMERTVEDIKGQVLPTNMLVQIQDHIYSCVSTRDKSPVKQYVNITVNLYPYKFSDAEKEVILSAMQDSFKGAESVNIVSIPQQFLNPKSVSQYTQYITYEVDEWLSMHGEELKENKMPRFMLSGPIKAIKPRAEEEIDLRDAVTGSKMFLAEHLELNLLPLKDFSFDIELAKLIGTTA